MTNNNQNLIFASLRAYRALRMSQILSQSAIIQGLDVKTVELTHMPVMNNEIVHMRIGNKIYSPLIPKGTADILICFEPLPAVEAICEYLTAQGTIIINTQPLLSIHKLSGELVTLFEQSARRIIKLEMLSIAKEAGGLAQSSFIMLGVLDGLNILPIQSSNISKAANLFLGKENRDIAMRAIDLGRKAVKEYR